MAVPVSLPDASRLLTAVTMLVVVSTVTSTPYWLVGATVWVWCR